MIFKISIKTRTPNIINIVIVEYGKLILYFNLPYSKSKYINNISKFKYKYKNFIKILIVELYSEV